VDDHGQGAGPLGDCGNVTAESTVVDFVDEDTEESSRIFVRIRLELGVNLDDERGSHGGEQTSLQAESALRRRGM